MDDCLFRLSTMLGMTVDDLRGRMEANQEHADGHFTLGQLVYCVAVVVAVAGLTVWAIGLIPIWV